MSDMSNQVRMEPGIERIELNGTFATGTIGRTITKDNTQEWELTKVISGEQFVITGISDNKDFSLSFDWSFEDEGVGTRLTQKIRANGLQIEKYREMLQSMEEGVPRNMIRFTEELDGLIVMKSDDD